MVYRILVLSSSRVSLVCLADWCNVRLHVSFWEIRRRTIRIICKEFLAFFHCGQILAHSLMLSSWSSLCYWMSPQFP
jgi:hypothetical protein